MDVLRRCVRHLFSTQYMVKDSERLGELPYSREAYLTFSALAWPAMIESMFVAMAGFIDTIMVSGASKTAIAAVGVTTQPRMLFYLLFFAMSSSTVALVSRRYGEGNREGANLWPCTVVQHQPLHCCSFACSCVSDRRAAFAVCRRKRGYDAGGARIF